MEDILKSLNGFEVSNYPNNPNAEHPRFSLFKLKVSGSSQEQRRAKILEARKQGRFDVISHMRQIEEGATDDESEDMECTDEVQACYQKPRRYKNFVMLSEWLVDVPEDFSSTYLALPCPVGKRSLVVSGRGSTKIYAKNGALITTFCSFLPGGCFKTKRAGYTILDCIWSEVHNTYYILDVIMWNRHSLLDCETELRFQWLKNRIEELDVDISIASEYNPIKFVTIPSVDCSERSLRSLMSNNLPFSADLDGVLFYHKLTHYTHGPTPLVGWLKGYMFPEILNVPVADKYMKEKPSKYVNLDAHIKYAQEEREQRIKNRANKMTQNGNKEKNFKMGDSESKMETTKEGK